MFGELRTIGGASRPSASRRASWWQRLLHRGTPSEQQARRAYRRSLPLWIRLRRYVAALLGLALVVLYFRVVGRDPVTWARHTWNNLRGTLVAVTDVRVSTDPPNDAEGGFEPKNAIDADPATAWAAPTGAARQAGVPPCTSSASRPALLMTLPKTVTLRAIALRAGLDATDPDRGSYWRPRELDLGFSASKCQRIVLADNPNWQKIAIHPVATNSVRISIATGYRPSSAPSKPFAPISEIRLLTRPA